MDAFGGLGRLLSDLWHSDKVMVRCTLYRFLLHLGHYLHGLYAFIYLEKPFHSTPYVLPDDLWAHTQIFSLALIFRMWKHPHYRNTSFQQDCIDTLQNVAIPGTGIPLSLFCYSYYTALFFVAVCNPIICLFGAINKANKEYQNFNQFLDLTVQHFISHLFHPQDWFSFWRLNCTLASYHSLITQSPGYSFEDKWEFLTRGHAMGKSLVQFPSMLFNYFDSNVRGAGVSLSGGRRNCVQEYSH